MFLAALKAKCLAQGVKFVTGDLVDFKFKEVPPGRALVSNDIILEAAKVCTLFLTYWKIVLG